MIETMSEVFHGMGIARRRIAEEAQARTGFLDLGGLGLATLPPELFRLRHLRELNLGAGLGRHDGSFHQAYDPEDDTTVRNDIDTKYFGDLRELPDLVALSVSATAIADLTPLPDLVALQSLDCRGTRVADLTPLASLVARASAKRSSIGSAQPPRSAASTSSATRPRYRWATASPRSCSASAPATACSSS